MPPALAVGCYLPQNVPPAVVFTWARAAEDAGLRALWLPDHLHHFPDKREGRLDAWSLLSALAVETSRIRLGLGVCNVQLRNPALLAKMAFTLDHLSDGRFDLALGTGGNTAEMRAYGIAPRTGIAARRRLVDTILTLRALEGGGPADTPPGSHAPLRSAYCRPTPVQRPFPLAIAGDHVDTLHIVAREADRWFANVHTPDQFATRNARLTGIVQAEGRPSDGLERSAHVLAIIGATLQQAQRAATAHQAAPRAPLFGEPHIVGDATAIADGLLSYQRAGATHAAVYILNLAACSEAHGVDLIRTLAEAAHSLS